MEHFHTAILTWIIVIKYIMNQKDHHKKKTFKEEYLELLKKFEIEFKDEYLFEWIDKKPKFLNV